MEEDERYYNARQACRILDCYPEEYRRLCTILSIIPQSYTELCKIVQDCTKIPNAPWDKRAKYISQTELEQLQELRGKVPNQQDQAAVAAEVERMRREIAALRAEVARLKAPSQALLHFVESEPDTDADGLLSKRYCVRLFAAHGVNENTASFWRAAITEAARRDKASALRWARDRMGRDRAGNDTRLNWHECSDPACPCHTL